MNSSSLLLPAIAMFVRALCDLGSKKVVFLPDCRRQQKSRSATFMQDSSRVGFEGEHRVRYLHHSQFHVFQSSQNHSKNSLCNPSLHVLQQENEVLNKPRVGRCISRFCKPISSKQPCLMLRTAAGCSRLLRPAWALQGGLYTPWEMLQGSAGVGTSSGGGTAAAAGTGGAAAAAAQTASSSEANNTPDRVAKVLAHSFHR